MDTKYVKATYWTFPYPRRPDSMHFPYRTGICADKKDIPDVVRSQAEMHTISVPERVYLDCNFRVVDFVKMLERHSQSTDQ